jgi:putative hemolysin
MSLVAVKIVLAMASLVFSAFFSSCETALLSLSRLQLGRLDKTFPGRLAFWEKSPDRVLAVLLLGTSLANVGLGVLATSLAFDLERAAGVPFQWGGWAVPAAAAVLLILFGEIVPKVFGRVYSETVALMAAPWVRLLTQVLGPLMHGFLKVTGRVVTWLSRLPAAQQAPWSAPVIRTLLSQSALTAPLRHMLNNLLDFGSVPVTRVMVPRPEIFTADLALAKTEFIDRILSSGYSRVPVTRGSIDNVVGIVYSKDLLASWRSEALIVVEDLIRPVPRVPPAMPLAQLLRDFRQGHNHVALVVDGQGRLQGLVTLQDALEAIVGPVAQEPGLKKG